MDGVSDRPCITCGIQPPASRPPVAQRFRPRALPLPMPEKPEWFELRQPAWPSSMSLGGVRDGMVAAAILLRRTLPALVVGVLVGHALK